MLPLDIVLQASPPHQVAGHFNIGVVGLLRPVDSPGPGGGIALCPLDALGPSMDVDAMFQRRTRSHVPRGTLDNHLLMLQPQARFLSTDDLSLLGVSQLDDRLTIDLMLTRSENEDGEPAPRLLAVLLHVAGADAGLRELLVTYHGRLRDFQGVTTTLEGAVAPPQIIPVSA